MLALRQQQQTGRQKTVCNLMNFKVFAVHANWKTIKARQLRNYPRGCRDWRATKSKDLEKERELQQQEVKKEEVAGKTK